MSYDGGNQLLPFDYTDELVGNPTPENLFAWDLAGFNPSTFTLTFKASSSSMSLDALAVDTFTQQGAFAPLGVPEPATGALAALGMLGMLAVRRRAVSRTNANRRLFSAGWTISSSIVPRRWATPVAQRQAH